MLKEQYTYREMISIFIAFIGASFVIRPSFIFGKVSPNPNHLFGTLMAISGALLNSCAVISIKILGNKSTIFE